MNDITKRLIKAAEVNDTAKIQSILNAVSERIDEAITPIDTTIAPVVLFVMEECLKIIKNLFPGANKAAQYLREAFTSREQKKPSED